MRPNLSSASDIGFIFPTSISLTSRSEAKKESFLAGIAEVDIAARENYGNSGIDVLALDAICLESLLAIISVNIFGCF